MNLAEILKGAESNAKTRVMKFRLRGYKDKLSGLEHRVFGEGEGLVGDDLELLFDKQITQVSFAEDTVKAVENVPVEPAKELSESEVQS